MRLCSRLLVSCTIVLSAAVPSFADQNDGAAAPPVPDGCFSRSYDAAHLARHPAQKTVGITARFRRDELTIALAEAARTLVITAGCGWQAQAGRDVQGKPLLPAFKGTAGYDCIVTYSADSGEEGGYLIFAPTAAADAATIYVDSPVAARPTPGGKARSLALGSDDRVFKLARAPAEACAALGK